MPERDGAAPQSEQADITLLSTDKAPAKERTLEDLRAMFPVALFASEDARDQVLHLLALQGLFTITKLDEEREAKEKAELSAKIDPLTRLPNRTIFEGEIDKALENGEAVGVLMLDLDKFKLVNDELGHIAGDRLLQIAARIMQASVREMRDEVTGYMDQGTPSSTEEIKDNSDLVARYGGEEFGIVLKGVKTPEDVAVVANRINEAFRAEPIAIPIPGKVANRPVTVSIGGGIFFGGSREEIIHKADEALYKAKHSGRDRNEIIDFNR